MLRLVDAGLEAVVAGRCDMAFLVVDLGEVRSFERGGPESLRHAPYSAAARGIAVYLSGCGGREQLLPLHARRVFAGFASFPTADHAVHALTGSGGADQDGPDQGSAPPATRRVVVPRPRPPGPPPPPATGRPGVPAGTAPGPAIGFQSRVHDTEAVHADLTERRLVHEFDGRVERSAIGRVLHGCRRDLQEASVPTPALAELVERLARQRLLQGERR